MSYYKNRNTLIKKANEHTEFMKKNYHEQIQKSIEETKTYIHSPIEKYKENRTPIKIKLLGIDSVSAIIYAYSLAKQKKIADIRKMAVLNFASFKNPGGQFLNGSSAQEESLCHESNLFNILKAFNNSYYANNRLYTNRNMYTNKCLYTPNVMFLRNNGEFLCDVITCAAPNKSAGQKYQHITNQENKEYLFNRIKFVLDVAEHEKVDTLILGAYGAGVFGQDPTEVAQSFIYLLKHNNYSFKTVLFAVPKKGVSNDSKELDNKFNKNYDAFKNVFYRVGAKEKENKK